MSVQLTEEAINLLAIKLRESPLGEGAGLRIWGNYVDHELVLTCGFVEGPTPVDEVVDQEGARVFVDRQVAEHLEEKTIAVQPEAGGLALVVTDDWFGEGDFRIS